MQQKWVPCYVNETQFRDILEHIEILLTTS